MDYRPTRDCERQAEQYADLADEARAQGKNNAADHFLLLAWAAYDDQDGALAPQLDPEQPKPELKALSRP